ncbi:MAG: (Dimethylallyl)adenosine tRNA methylthiotransferase MiaB [Candidatus Magasanikbacteria bacterium GW2011_GWC2_34_16]|uniref:tRNA-2-methylthio-N(6)-dimethylallyladenosine synthase n=2 Tax=Candidatus Magasanikiibacteriota TaxID=1752731 RepID=A0A0G0HDJ5_9BACT|nr:MAG: (Dimethylallyl)adenosine tRNA methylthiotransferase MiaB [Candidatus Magasanikbacteria bacterium GW2011_GWC2_34_16]KKQ41238.1 MAG: (Dimethylallyl)adenosine tRNA methylthiotransferase MiaB [Candidatus Magasanikbacteria bacterium GW2011_GWA2_37_8]
MISVVMEQKYFYILTFGCQMNSNDSERVASLLLSLGLQETKSSETADLLVVNTCSVRQSAEDRVWGFIRNWQEYRQNKPNLVIAVTGCMPGRDKNGKIQKRLPGVDLFFPIEELTLLPKRLAELNPEILPNSFTDLQDYLSINPSRGVPYRASIAIQTGCNNFCTYCVVPYARGRERNRPVVEIVNEIKKAAESGVKEVVLLGQVVNNYHASTGEDFADLLKIINSIDGLERVHWTAADPQYFDDNQIRALNFPKQLNYLHLPVQSGDNEVLKKMNRHYTSEYYIDLIKKIRNTNPEIAIGTDIIVGFCGETDKQFQNTVDLCKQCDFDIVYLARYSERSGTVAAQAFKDDVPKIVKKQRWEILQHLMEEIVLKKNQKYNGQVVSVLVEKCNEGICSGNSREMKVVQFLGAPNLVGQIVQVKINQAEMWRLKGVQIK